MRQVMKHHRVTMKKAFTYCLPVCPSAQNTSNNSSAKSLTYFTNMLWLPAAFVSCFPVLSLSFVRPGGGLLAITCRGTLQRKWFKSQRPVMVESKGARCYADSFVVRWQTKSLDCTTVLVGMLLTYETFLSHMACSAKFIAAKNERM